ncbi:MAG TPA: hypothetical protein VLA72_15680 [Anaerolineales bacterium]|nr:hypothetical protein [Anaerolineales bacterium]
MEAITSLIVFLAGLLLRLAIPIAVTAVLIYGLRKLDARWQAEAQIPIQVEKPKCWEIKGCAPEDVKNCIAGQSPMPCWQAYRLPNGYLRDECLSCEVFRHAPVPA